jgi:hypothetical protein
MTATDQLKALSLRRVLLGAWGVTLPVTAFLYLQPIGSRPIRGAIVALLSLLWAEGLALWWRRRAVRVLALGMAGCVGLVVAVPGREPEPTRLRADCVKALVAYEGTRYVWGGENRAGIDCSGLVRRGLIDALLYQGIKTANATLMRRSFVLRWYDCSARALLEGYGGQTQPTVAAPSIAKLDHRLLQPGDFAVTADGVHTLAFLGEALWIEADPSVGRVIKIRAMDDNGWLHTRVQVLRWRLLMGAARD